MAAGPRGCRGARPLVIHANTRPPPTTRLVTRPAPSDPSTRLLGGLRGSHVTRHDTSYEPAERQPGVAVDVLVEQVAEGAGAAGVAGLGAEGAQPHEVAGLDLDPVGVEQVDGLALEHVQAVLHHVRLRERDRAAGLEVDDVDVHVVAEVVDLDEARRRPRAVRCRACRPARPRARWSPTPRGPRLPRPAGSACGSSGTSPSPRSRCGASTSSRAAGRRSRPAPARTTSPPTVSASVPDTTNSTASAPGSTSGRGTAAGPELHDVLAERLREPRQRSRQHPHPHAVPAGQVRRGDVALRARRDHGVRLGEPARSVVSAVCGGSPPRGTW